MSQNPLAGLVPYIADTDSRPLAPAWAVIASTDPLRVRFPGEEEARDVTPLSLAPMSELATGRRVLTQYMGTSLVILGAAHAGGPGPGRWSVADLQNGWQHYTAFGSLAWRLEGDVVRLTGAVRDGTSGPDTPITVLPADARPSTTRLITAHYADAMVDARVSPDGALYISTGTPGYVSFEGTTYRR